MSDMIWRVAKAIYEKRNGPGCYRWVNRPSGHKAPYLADARAAIEAMRDPCPSVQLAGAVELQHQRVALEEDSPSISIGRLFNAMIDSALSQDTPSLPTPAATPTDSANPPPVESVGPNSEARP